MEQTCQYTVKCGRRIEALSVPHAKGTHGLSRVLDWCSTTFGPGRLVRVKHDNYPNYFAWVRDQ